MLTNYQTREKAEDGIHDDDRRDELTSSLAMSVSHSNRPEYLNRSGE